MTADADRAKAARRALTAALAELEAAVEELRGRESAARIEPDADIDPDALAAAEARAAEAEAERDAALEARDRLRAERETDAAMIDDALAELRAAV